MVLKRARQFLIENIAKRHGRQLMCHKEECEYVRSGELVTGGSLRLRLTNEAEPELRPTEYPS